MCFRDSEKNGVELSRKFTGHKSSELIYFQLN